jgi:hypothetical protein
MTRKTLNSTICMNILVSFKFQPTFLPLGTRYNDEIYFYMSRGILNPNILETIPNE